MGREYKISNQDAAQIREMIAGGASQREIAELLGVSRTAVRTFLARTGTDTVHAAGWSSKTNEGRARSRTIYTLDDMPDIIRRGMEQSGLTQQALAERAGVPSKRLSDALRGPSRYRSTIAAALGALGYQVETNLIRIRKMKPS